MTPASSVCIVLSKKILRTLKLFIIRISYVKHATWNWNISYAQGSFYKTHTLH
jgi:hypothetical protein